MTEQSRISFKLEMLVEAGEILTLLFVTDVRESVAFYKSLGFEHDYYYDYQEDVYRIDWH